MSDVPFVPRVEWNELRNQATATLTVANKAL